MNFANLKVLVQKFSKAWVNQEHIWEPYLVLKQQAAASG